MEFKNQTNFSNVSGIYIIKNSVNSKVYIGSAVNLKARYRVHKHLLNSKKHFSKPLQNHCNKYGIGCLTFFVLLVCNRDDLIKNEQEQIDKYLPFNENGFNSNFKANSSIGLKRSKESIEKSVKTKRENGWYEKWSIMFPAIHKGNNYKKGSTLSEETKTKIGMSSKGRKHSTESIGKIRIASTGRNHSQEAKDKMSKLKMGNKINLGRIQSNETKSKISIANSIPIIQISMQGDLIKEWPSGSSAAKALNINKANINSVILGKRISCGGFKWVKK